MIRDLCAIAKRVATPAKGRDIWWPPCPGKSSGFWLERTAAVEAGQGVVVVEAMKMQNEIKSPKKGIVLKLSVSEGAAVNAGDVLAIVE